MGDVNMCMAAQPTELPLNHEDPATVEPMELTTHPASAPATNGLKSPKRMSVDSTDATHGASEYGTGGSRKGDRKQQSKRRRGPEFRCPYFAANPDTCQDAKCQSWHNPCIAAVTRHALRDSSKNDATGSQSRAIKSLSHRKLSPEDRWKHYYEIHGGVDAYEQGQPYWPQSTKAGKTSLQTGPPVPNTEFSLPSRKTDDVAAAQRSSGSPSTDSRNHIHRHECNTFGAVGHSRCNSLDIQSSDDLSQALLELIAMKEARDDAIDTEIEEREAKKIAALRSEIAQEKLAEKSRNQSEFVARLKKIIMHSQSGNLPHSVPAGSQYEQVKNTQSEKDIGLPEATGSRRSNSPPGAQQQHIEVLED